MDSDLEANSGRHRRPRSFQKPTIEDAGDEDAYDDYEHDEKYERQSELSATPPPRYLTPTPPGPGANGRRNYHNALKSDNDYASESEQARKGVPSTYAKTSAPRSHSNHRIQAQSRQHSRRGNDDDNLEDVELDSDYESEEEEERPPPKARMKTRRV